MPPYLVLDSNLIGFEPPLGSNDARVLLDAARQGQLHLAVPELVVREVMNKWREMMTTRLSKFGSAATNLGELGAAIQVPSEQDLNELEVATEARFREALEAPNCMVPGFPGVAHEEVVGRALRRDQPFDKNGKDGYRDTLLWETVLELAAMHEDVHVGLVSNDLAAFATGDQGGLSKTLVQDVAERVGRPDAVELCTSLEMAVERFAQEDSRVVERAARLVRVDSFRTILDEQIEDIVEGHTLDAAEISSLGLPAPVPYAHTVGMTRGLGRIEVGRAFEIEDGIGLVDFSVLTGAEIGFYTSFERAMELRERGDIWPAQVEWDELRPSIAEDIHLMISRFVELHVECAVRLVPGTIERLKLLSLRAIDAEEFSEAEHAIDEEPGEVWPAEGAERR